MAPRAVGFRFRFRASHRGVSLGLALGRGPRRQRGFVGGAIGGKRREVVAPAFGDDTKGRIARDCRRAQPRLHRRATHRTVHEADGHPEFLKEIAREKISDRGKLTDRFRRRQLPPAGRSRIGRSIRHARRDPHMAYERPASGRELSRGVGHARICLPTRTGTDREFHVGLPGTQPDLTDHDVAHDHHVFPAHREFRALAPRRERV